MVSSWPNPRDRRHWPGCNQSSMRWARSRAEKRSSISPKSLPITSRLKPRFDTLIGRANRANIVVYPVDAAGLRIHSKEAELGRNVTLAGAQGVGDSARGDGPYTKEMERQEQMLSSRPTAVLGRLAKETGGFLLENTNDLGAGCRAHEARTHDLLSAGVPVHERRARRHVSKNRREGEAVEGHVPRAFGVRRHRKVASRHDRYSTRPLPSTIVT